MIKLIASRNGMLEGVSLVPTKDVHNPYFLFGAETHKENQELLAVHFSNAEVIHNKMHRGNMGGVIPEYTIRALLLWQDLNYPTLSYPEIGCIPGVQSRIMCIIASVALANPDKEIKIITTSEYMFRTSQLLVLSKILKPTDIVLYDTESDGIPAQMEFQLPEGELQINKYP